MPVFFGPGCDWSRAPQGMLSTNRNRVFVLACSKNRTKKGVNRFHRIDGFVTENHRGESKTIEEKLGIF
jgi:hypothetical protein